MLSEGQGVVRLALVSMADREDGLHSRAAVGGATAGVEALRRVNCAEAAAADEDEHEYHAERRLHGGVRRTAAAVV